MESATPGTVRSYCDDLLVALRAREVPGARIGEVLAEVESHVAETGEEPREAFGPPREYADRVADALGVPRSGVLAVLFRGLGWADLTVAVVTGLCCFALADGLWSVGAGTDSVLGLPAGAVSAGAAAVLAASIARTVRAGRRDRAADAVVDPRTGRDMAPLAGRRVVLLAAVPVLMLTGMLVGGILSRG